VGRKGIRCPLPLAPTREVKIPPRKRGGPTLPRKRKEEEGSWWYYLSEQRKEKKKKWGKEKEEITRVLNTFARREGGGGKKGGGKGRSLSQRRGGGKSSRKGERWKQSTRLLRRRGKIEARGLRLISLSHWRKGEEERSQSREGTTSTCYLRLRWHQKKKEKKESGITYSTGREGSLIVKRQIPATPLPPATKSRQK